MFDTMALSPVFAFEHSAQLPIPYAAWYYSCPTHPHEALAGYVAIYPGKIDTCYVNGEKVQMQEGDFYCGRITDEIIGPFKGGTGTSGW